MPFDVQRRAIRVELPLSILVALLLLVMVADPLLDGAPTRRISRTDGLLALGLFAIFLYTLVDAMGEPPDSGAGDESGVDVTGKRTGVASAALRLVVGLAVLLVSSRVIVLLAVDVAGALGVPERIVGLTVVSVGTSLPELVTSVAAARRREMDIAIGNVLGSNIFNVLLILAVSAVVSPVPVSGGAHTDLLANLGAAVLVLVFVLTGGGRRVTRVEASVLLLSYVAYMSVSVVHAV
jgi:cation:H+ antiporter